MYRVLSVCLVLCLLPASVVLAHQAACHRKHSCPADPEAYVCGDLGHCKACPDNQYCLNRQPRRPAAAQQQAKPPAAAHQQAKPPAAATASQAKPAKAVPAHTTEAPSTARQPTKVAPARDTQAQPAPRQVSTPAATPAATPARSQAQPAREPADDTKRQWDTYERQLQTYCTQVSPTSVRQCMHNELARQDTEQARQLAKKYSPVRPTP